MSGGADGKICFIKTSNWKVDKVFEKAHKGSAVNYISVHPSGKLALSIGADLKLKTWNLINGRQAFANSLKNTSLGNIIDFVVWSTTGDHFAITGKDVVEIWSTEKAEVVATKKCQARPSAICWITNSDLLVGMEDGKILFFNWEDEEEDETICEIYESRVKAMKYLDGFLATASSGGELNLWKITMGDKVELDMLCGVDVGCRLICLDITIISGEAIEPVKDEDEEELKKTQVRQLKTSGEVTIEIDAGESDDEPKNVSVTKSASKKRKQKQVEPPTSSKKKNQRKSVRLSNGFIEEDC